jgi:hypothetical protein
MPADREAVYGVASGMTWQPNVRIKDGVDIYHPSFPWKHGKPDWDQYRAIKNEERAERNKGQKVKIAERCCAMDGDQRCHFKSVGKLEIEQDGEMKLAPLCQKHKNLFA